AGGNRTVPALAKRPSADLAAELERVQAPTSGRLMKARKSLNGRGTSWGEDEKKHGGGWGLDIVILVCGITASAGFVVLLTFSRPSRKLLRPAWVWKLAAVLGLMGVLGVALLSLAPLMSPVRDGDPARFWLNACGIDVGVSSPLYRGGYHQPRDGW